MAVRVSHLLILNSKSMKNSQTPLRRGRLRLLFKFVVIMKLSILLILLGILQAKANVHAQGSITLTMQQEEIVKVLNKIEKKGEFRFLYNYDLASLRKKVNVNFQNSDLKEVLRHLFAGTDLTYKILENNLVVVMSSSGKYQDIRITGKVTGANGEALAGVSILVKGTSRGVNTDFNGSFTLTVPQDAVLVVSSIGFESKEVKVNNESVVNIQMLPSNKKLDEVVVIGYGTQRQKDITSAISTVSVKDVSERPIVSTSEVLAGKAPGVQVFQSSGQPGTDLSIRIRGIASPNGNQPIYVIDGVIANDAKSLDPNTIESISVLKDASAAGIYGAAGSTNGVVMITTKQGSKGRQRTDLSVYSGIQQVGKKIDLLNNTQYLSLLHDEYTNAGSPVPQVADTVNNNWQNLVYRNAVQTGVNAGFSGGSDKSTYYLGIGYLNQEGIIRTSNFTRYAVKLSLEQTMNNWLSVGTHVSYNRANQSTVNDNASANHGGVILAALLTPPLIPITNPASVQAAQGIYADNPLDGNNNPYADIYGSTNNNILNNLLGDIHTEIKLPLGIKYRSQLGISLENSDYDYFLSPYNTAQGINKKGSATNTTWEAFRWTWENTLSYSKIFGKNSINAVVGSSAVDEKYYNNSQSGTGFATAAVPTLNAASSNFTVSTTKSDWATASYFGRAIYSYDDKYLVTGTLRQDASSKLGADHHSGVFPAASAGWRLSKEDFLANSNFIEDLKIRAGWGETGNLPPTNYNNANTLNAGALYAFGSSLTNVAGVAPTNPDGNPDLKWEATRQINVGFDISVLKGRISLSGDYYDKKTKDLIFEEITPATSGNGDGQTYVNLPGYVLNKGFEFALSGKLVAGREFNWSSTLNLSFNKNKVTGLPDTSVYQQGGVEFGASGTTTNIAVIKNGLPLGALYGNIDEGVDPATGNIKFSPNQTYLGSGLPTFVFGFINNFSYKNFGLDVLIDGVRGNQIYNAARAETEGMGAYSSGNATTAVLNRWTHPGQVTDMPMAIFGDPNQNARISSRFVESGDFLRFKSASLSYHLQSDNLKSIGIHGLRLYVTAQNLFTITGYKGYNPEVNGNYTTNGSGTISSTVLGIDDGIYPQTRTYTVGLNVEL
jgi:TonB-dependent starch-binding outer membrane protein SusC